MQLTTWQHIDQPLEYPLFAALASGLPIAVGVWFGHMNWGLVGSLGGMAFLYTHDTPMSHRMVQLMASAFGVAASYALGLMSQFLPWGVGRVLVLALIATLATMLGRFYRISPVGGLFFVMTAAIAAYMRVDPPQIPFYIGLVFMGAIGATALAFIYSAYRLWGRASQPIAPPAPATFEVVILDAIVIGASVGVAQAVAEALRFDRPYWASVACIGVIQGMTFRAVWDKQIQRVLGTGAGLLLAGTLLTLPLGSWGDCVLMMALTFMVQICVVRQYALGTMFFTPLSIFVIEAANAHPDVGALVKARFFDTLLGSVVIHHAGCRALIRHALERLMPARLVRLVRAQQ